MRRNGIFPICHPETAKALFLIIVRICLFLAFVSQKYRKAVYALFTKFSIGVISYSRSKGIYKMTKKLYNIG